MIRTIKIALAILAACFCPAAALAVSVSLAPTTVHVQPGNQVQFTATVSGDSNTVVIWSLSGTNCGGTACGQISSTGLYQAPPTPPNPDVVTVTATALADVTASASAAVIVGSSSDIAVKVSPATATVAVSQQQSFVAYVSGTTITDVTWSLNGAGCNTGSGCGIITHSGTYIAPATLPSPAQLTVVATSVADPSRSGSAQVTITAPVDVQVSPATVSINAGLQQQFKALVTNSSNTAVTWSVSCAGTGCGSVSSGGLFTAPPAPPNPPQVSIVATSVADTSKTGTATVTVLPAVAIVVSPASVQLVPGAHQQFTATVTNTSNTAVTWSLSGSLCSGSACGTVSTTGLYTAPATAPSSNVTVIATSAVDPSKTARATVQFAGSISVSVTPATTNVALGATLQFTASVSGSTNQNASWTLTGAGCSGASCGTITSAGLFTAPFAMPTPAQVTVTATSAADSTKSGSAIVTLIHPIVVTIAPTKATVAGGARQQFLATISGTTDSSVTWSVSGTGCAGDRCGTISTGGLYTAPTTLPSPALVTVTVASRVDPTRLARATVTLVAPVGVTVSPASVSVSAGNHQQFTATVTGSTNTAVTWTVAGAGCTGAACGVMSSTGLYNAPGTVPNPATVTVTATSTGDPTKSGSASVTILPPVAVTVTPATVQVVVNTQRQFAATVTGTQNAGVNWSLAGTGCSGSDCGSVSSAGLYTAPPAVPSPATVTLTAQSVADPTKSGIATIIIIPPVSVTVAPASATIAAGAQQQFRATVVGSTTKSVRWKVAGAGCKGTACGTITAQGLYTAPAGIPSPASVSITASAVIDPTESASAAVTVVANANSRLAGQYAFAFTGLEEGTPYQAAGEFTADGAGNIIAGLEDVNSPAGPATSVALTGSYTIGSDNRGVMSLASSTSTQTVSFTLDFAGARGRFIEMDASGITGSGSFEKQDPAAFTNAVLLGPWVLSLAGRDSADKRIGALGLLALTGPGTVQTGSMDVNEGGQVSPTFPSVTGTCSVGSAGRGTASLSIPGFLGGSFRFALYVVSASKVFLVSIDPLAAATPILSGQAQLQSGAPFQASSFNGPTVFSLSGENNNVPVATAGQIVFDGVTQPRVHLDQNAGGVITTNKLFTGAYSMSDFGSGTLDLDDSHGHELKWYLYAIGPNHAFLLDVSSPNVGMGELLPQSSQPPFSAANILGTYWLGSGEPLVQAATLYSGFTDFDGKFAISATEDVIDAGGPLPGQTMTGNYSVGNPLNGGRVMLFVPASSEVFGLWVASNQKVIGVEIDTTNTHPVVLYFEQ